ncbi:MAG: DNA cytosine methyltransferase, partial [Thermoproteus sp.]|nr:DNA cytosine methyltransferase [Thermoproteus sp.]
MKVISLFSGAGGLDWGFNKPPYRIIFANDVNSMATCTYAKNFGLRHVGCVASEGVVANCDVAQLDFKELDADIIAGGPPCQDFSIVRGPDRRGIEVRRGKLYMHFVRALTTIEPSAFVFESVPGLLTSNDGLAFKAILSDFRKSGYEIPFVGIVDFSALGVPQRRKRLIIIGVRKDLLKGIGDFWTAKALAERALRGSV